ncbi:nitrate- and nitrite sensing domain-containing protein [Streptomyces cocklensis]|nr:nitrate- and nitrite sensing domain-containing protein [Actinacidiphila cocklensis]
MLIILVLVPGLGLSLLWGLGTYQLLTQWQAEKAQRNLGVAVGNVTVTLLLDLEQERRLTADVQADPGAANRGSLAAQRAVTDRAVRDARTLVHLDTAHGQKGLAAGIADTEQSLDALAEQRKAVDAATSSEQQAFDYYSEALDSLLGLLTALTHSSNGDTAALSQSLVDLFSAMDMIGREDALLARGWRTAHLTTEARDGLIDAIGTQEYLLQSRVAPFLTGEESSTYRALTTSKAWQNKKAVEEQLVAAGAGSASDRQEFARTRADWRTSVDKVQPQLLRIVAIRADSDTRVAADSVRHLRTLLIGLGVAGLLALALVVATSWRLTVVLRRRILGLREEAQELQTRLPDVVARLERSEDVDVDAEIRLLEPTPDELGELGRALNLASRSAVSTAVRQAQQHRGFERLLQRIARRTQILIGLQLKKLDELENKHEDPEVLEGLFDLDHLTARLRRYEENLVILGGGLPQRRWRRPVRLLDVLRAAQGEVQDYRRIEVEVEDEPWVAERAVGPLVHIIAELMENAAAFSRPPTPVEVRAARVSRGVAVEIEDRGLGMVPAQYAAANALMESPPQLDVLTHAEDVRFGLYVVARLSKGLDLQVELRPSAFGGTRVIVLLPESRVVGRPAEVPRPAVRPAQADVRPTGPRPHPPQAQAGGGSPAAADGKLPVRSRGHAMAHVTAAPSRERGDAYGSTGVQPLPQRVRQASLAAELRVPADEAGHGGQETRGTDGPPSRSGAVVGAFQRESRRARKADSALRPGLDGLPEVGSATREDRE